MATLERDDRFCISRREIVIRANEIAISLVQISMWALGVVGLVLSRYFVLIPVTESPR